VRGGAELPTHRAGPRTRSRVFCVIGPPVRALEEASRQLALASGAADPNPGADVFAPLVVNRIGLASGRPSRSSKGGQHVFPSWPRAEAEWLGATAARYHHSPNHRQWRKGTEVAWDNGKPEWTMHAGSPRFG
jgi:hypothetical protein